GRLRTRTAPWSNRAAAEKSAATPAFTVRLADFCVCPESSPGMGRTMLTVADAPSPVEASEEGGLMPTALLEPELASTKSTSTRIILLALTLTRFSTFSAAAQIGRAHV